MIHGGLFFLVFRVLKNYKTNNNQKQDKLVRWLAVFVNHLEREKEHSYKNNSVCITIRITSKNKDINRLSDLFTLNRIVYKLRQFIPW